MGSSFDQVGTLTKTVADARVLLSVIAGYDSNDSNTKKKSDEKDFLITSNRKPSEIRIAVPQQAFTDALDTRVEQLFREKLEALKLQGYQVEFVDFPLLSLEYIIPVYYLLISAEVTSNLSRFDGVRF
jgi:aspartyl-tRNA(Asn)/glutamyl-tRNA(Gln) amidotransferase subunit A